ncbi:hypothetical protein AB0L80_38665 [Streptomyces sp. NPDC052069]|uniref:hypothetical protein n=1 Tax=Streptomyces sp. NPDC052069 TaxID=3154650 RepID=UPI003447B753
MTTTPFATLPDPRQDPLPTGAPVTLFDDFTRRTTDVTAQLAAHGIPLTAPAVPSAPSADPTGPWAARIPLLVDRTSLAWCTAAQMLADHHHTGIDRQVLSADALLRELGVRGLAQLHSDLHHGARIDYRYTRCPYCDGLGEDPTLPTCQVLGCPPRHEHDDHPHLCPVCHGDDHQPQYLAEEHMRHLEQLLAEAIKDKAPLRPRIGAWLHRR